MKAMKVKMFMVVVNLCTILFMVACTLDPAGPVATTPSLPWGDHNLTGKLIFIQWQNGKQNLTTLDLATNELSVLFAVPDKGWLSQADVSPDGNQVVLAYAPPPTEGARFGYSSLYLVLADGVTEPRPLLTQSNPAELFFNPVWSPDSRYIYYSHAVPDEENLLSYVTTLERFDYITGEVNVIVENAIWPRLSPDGNRLAYVTFDPVTLENTLQVTDDDGANVVTVLPADAFPAVDAPLFAPDSQTLYFSALPPTPVTVSWVERLMGVKVAAAHDAPSDWWRISLAGGTPERLTTLDDMGLYGDFSPDGRYLAFVSDTGLYLMNPDGSGLLRLIETSAANALSWIP
jgi:Tol biopolymer transport system component